MRMGNLHIMNSRCVGSGVVGVSKFCVDEGGEGSDGGVKFVEFVVEVIGEKCVGNAFPIGSCGVYLSEC